MNNIESSVLSPEIFEHIQISWFDAFLFVLITIHEDTHGKTENKNFPMRQNSYKSSFLKKHPKSLEELGYQIESELRPSAAGFCHDCKNAYTTGNHDIPTVNFLSLVFH